MISAKLESTLELAGMWEFFLQGLNTIRRPDTVFAKISDAQFFKTMSWIIDSKSKGDGVFVFYKEGKPIGYIALVEWNEPFTENRNLYIYCAYAVDHSSGMLKKLIEFALEHAKREGFHSVEWQTARFTGAAKRLHMKLFGFKPRCVVFRKDLE